MSVESFSWTEANFYSPPPKMDDEGTGKQCMEATL